MNNFLPYLLPLPLLIVVVILLLRIRRIKNERDVERLRDEETGMGNLHYFQNEFRNMIDDVAYTSCYVAYLILDSGYLRSYHKGSSFGETLQTTVAVLFENTKDREFSARITENGFAMALRCADHDEIIARMEKLLRKLNTLDTIKGHSNTPIFHAAVYRLTNADKNCEILLFNLRRNCNELLGTKQTLVYCDVHSMNRIHEEMRNSEKIVTGLDKNEFKMYLQFVVDNKTKKIKSAEALSRWENSKNGVIAPGKYIGNMERSGLISRHDFYMFELVCQKLEQWSETDYRDLSISCNFTRITLSEGDFIEKITSIAEKYKFDHEKLAIEITEDAMEENRDTAMKNVRKCKELGFSIYLDDLGSGYTSLTNLCDYPIDVVKLDREILLKTDTPKGQDLFAGIIALAHSLNIKVICEGVETEAQNELVSATDCDYVQGWHYSKALPSSESEAFIKHYQAR
ncbi:MAG: GGDEF domain-containing protein [Ruminococcaceae bacterium]|nr:GGDEF domain-containing protein [Oscillospiraceae bacterium]